MQFEIFIMSAAINIIKNNKMDVKILKSSNEEIEFEIGSLTLAEILRVYLNKEPAVSLAAWKRTHPTKNPILIVKTRGKSAKKVVEDAVEDIEKDLDKFLEEYKKMK